MADVAELAIVVVFQHPGARVRRPAQERQPARQRQRHAKRALMGWRHDGQPGIRCGSYPGVDLQALAIHWHGRYLDACCPERLAGQRVARILHPDDITWVQQRLRHQRQGALKSGGDHHLFGRAGDPTRNAQVCSDSLAQGTIPGRMGVDQLRRAQAACRPGAEPGP